MSWCCIAFDCFCFGGRMLGIFLTSPIYLQSLCCHAHIFCCQMTWDLEGPKNRQISKSSMSTASSEVEQMDDHEASAAALDDIVVSILFTLSMSSKTVLRSKTVFSFFERGIGIQRLGCGGISCHGNPRCTRFSLLKTGQLDPTSGDYDNDDDEDENVS